MMPDTTAPLAGDSRLSELRVLITRMAGFGKTAPEIRTMAMQWSEIVADPPLPLDTVEDVLADQMLRLTPTQRVPVAPVLLDDDLPPVDVTDARGALEIDREAPFERKVGDSKHGPQGRILDFAKLAESRAPEFRWYVPGWLSPHPTLLSGKGGMGKSLAALQLAVALARGKAFLGRAVDPLRILLWSCEEDLPELHRRLERICEFYEIGMSDLSGQLTIDCRHGLDNTLLTQEFGRPLWTGLSEYLREQANDTKADVWIGDNLAHMYACSENDRHPVTIFTSWLSGLRGEPWCPLLIGHVAKVGGSEYSGSTAWENAVRMRWYLGDKLPDEDKSAADEDESEPGNLRFLCKRKTNYDQKDYVRFTMQDGLLVPERIEADVNGDSGWLANLRARKARDVVLRGLEKITEMGVNSSERGGQANLGRLILQFKLAEGCTPRQLSSALAELMVDGTIIRGETGRDASRRKREGLVIAAHAKSNKPNGSGSMGAGTSTTPADAH